MAYVHMSSMYLSFNLTSCSYSAGVLQVKGALILILLGKCRPASESFNQQAERVFWLPAINCAPDLPVAFLFGYLSPLQSVGDESLYVMTEGRYCYVRMCALA